MGHIVIIGAGQAGFACAAKLRAIGYAHDITLIGQERFLPYQRPPLSKSYLLGDMTLERLFFRPSQFFNENNITLLLNKTVRAISPTQKKVHLDDDNINYDQLVLATGAQPRQLSPEQGGNLANIFTIRTLADIDAIRPNFLPAKKCLLVGGGYIGLEAASVAIKCGLDVSLIEQSSRILQRVAAVETSNYFRTLHRANGVALYENVALEHLVTHEDGHIIAHLNNGCTLEADFVLVGIGVLPRTMLVEEYGLCSAHGIIVDEFGRTQNPSIWAAGDCALFPYKGKPTRIESVQNAIDQAENIAENIMGAHKPYQAVPWFWSDQYDVKLQIVGLNRGYNRVITRKNGPEKGSSFWYYHDDRLLAVDALNSARAYMVAKHLIEADTSPDPACVENIEHDPKNFLTGI